MTTSDEKRRLRSLHKQASEMLMDDSRLWDGLDDEQAAQLLKWGIDQVKRLLPQTASLSDEETEAWLDERITAVGQMMIKIKGLSPELSSLNASSLKTQLAGLLDNLQELTGETIRGQEQNWLSLDWKKWDAAEAFRQLLKMLGFELDKNDD